MIKPADDQADDQAADDQADDDQADDDQADEQAAGKAAGKADEQKRAATTADRLRRARLMNYKTLTELRAAVGKDLAQQLMRAENEYRRLPTGALINAAADVYRVSTDYLYGRISCAESEDEQLMRIGLVAVCESLGERMIRFMGNQIGHASSEYLELIQPLGLGTLLKHADEFIAVTSTMDFTPPVRFALNQLHASVAEIKEARNDRQQRLTDKINKAQSKVKKSR